MMDSGYALTIYVQALPGREGERERAIELKQEGFPSNIELRQHGARVT